VCFGLVAAAEPLEQVGDEFGGHTVAGVGDGEAEMAVVLCCGDSNRRGSVAEGVDEQVRDDPVDRLRIEVELEVGRDVQLDFGCSTFGDEQNDLLQLAVHLGGLAFDRGGVGVDAGEVEELFDEAAQARGLFVGDRP
jgi:hypothetical protein